MHPHFTLRNWTRLTVSAGLLAAAGIAQAQEPTPPPGYVFQGTWHDGHWDGQWIPGGAPGMMPQGPMPQGGYAPAPMAAPMADRHTQHMIDRCRYYHHDSVAGGAIVGGVAGGVIGNRLSGGNRIGGTIAGAAVGGVAGAAIEGGVKHGRDRECERFFNENPDYAPGYASGPPMGPGGPYGAMPYGAAPMGYMMVPVMQVPLAPYTETKTYTTEYVTTQHSVRHYHVVHAKPHRDKRVYTGS